MIGPRPSRVMIPFIASGAVQGAEQVFLDTFTGSGPLSSHTPDVGSAWTITGDVPALTGAGALELNTGFAVTDITVDIDSRIDTTWEFTCDALWGSNLVIRFNELEPTNRWHVYWSPPYVQLYQIVAGVQTQRGATFTDGVGATSIKIRITTNEGTNGDTVNVYINDALEITWTATGRPLKDNTILGMRSFVAGDQVLLDRVEVIA